MSELRPGALDGVLSSNAEVKALFNHNADTVLGSRKNGTLALKSNDLGLFFAIELDKTNAKHREVHSMCKRGDVDGCSFGFFPEDEEWDQVRDENGKVRVRRTLKKINMHEMSVVTFPAYKSTMVQARSIGYAEQIRKAKATTPVLRRDDFFAAANKRAQQIKDEIFRTADAFIIPDYKDGKPWEVTPVFYTEAEKDAILDSQLRERAAEVERQMRADELFREILGDD